MIKWCAYCQGFIAEVEPYDVYGVTHGICGKCMPSAGDFGERELDKLGRLTRFYDTVKSVAIDGAPADVRSILGESRRLGIGPVDLLFGMLGPLLAEVGDLWASNRISVQAEHRASGIVEELLAGIRAEMPGRDDPSAHTELVLVNAEGNYHTIGARVADVYLASVGVRTITIVPGLPTDELLGLLETVRPATVGFSVALPTQMKQVREVSQRLRELPNPPRRVIVGGPALRLGLAPDASLGLDVCRDLSAIPALLGHTS